jgi:HPr kinase/phosphorylase
MGVLLIGPSGSGKTETCLELLEQEHEFIADDAVAIQQTSEGLIGGCLTKGQGLAHVRGLGLIKFNSVTTKCRIDLIIRLNIKGEDNEAEKEIQNEELLGKTLPSITFNHCRERNLPLLIQLAVKNL